MAFNHPSPRLPMLVFITIIFAIITLILLQMTSLREFRAWKQTWNRLQSVTTQDSFREDTFAYITVKSVPVWWNDVRYEITHECAGTLHHAANAGAPEVDYCLGTNRLVARSENGTLVGEYTNIDRAENAPVLSWVASVPKNMEGTILIRYAEDGCATANKCDVDFTAEDATHLFHLKKNSARQLLPLSLTTTQNGEKINHLSWNSNGTRAIVLPNKPTEVFDAQPLCIFNLETDETFCTEKTGSTLAGAVTILGQPIPLFTDIMWEDDNTVTAIWRESDSETATEEKITLEM